MTNKTAIRARELSFSQWHINLLSAVAASFACVPGIDFHDLSTACYSFVGQERDKLVPGRIRDMFSEMMIFEHVLDSEVFNLDSSILLSEPSAEFVCEIFPLISYLEVEFGEPSSCFSSVSRTFLFSADTSMQEFQSLFRLDEELWVVNDFSSGKYCKVFNSDINADGLSVSVFGFSNIDFTGKDGKPLPCSVPFYGECLDFAFRHSMEDDWHRANLGHTQPPLIEEFISSFWGGLWVGNTIDRRLEARETFFPFRSLRVFYPSEEVSKCLMHPVRDILCNLRMYFSIFTAKMFIVVKLSQRLTRFFVSLFGNVKKFIIDYFTGIKRNSPTS